MAQNTGTKKSTKSTKPSYVKTLWKVFALFWAGVVLFFVLLSAGLLGFMPSFEELENPHSNLASEVIASDGEILGFIGIENRSNVTFDEISPNIINALIATEDERFYKHSGIDARSLFRVLFKTVLGRHGSSGGGSTITQQLAKNLFPRENHGKLGLIHAKFKEWVVAVKLEHNYSKQEILAMYFNTVDFGSNAYGVKTAAKTFFDKAPSELNIEEAAVMVGLLKAPTTYSPVLHHDNSLRRRNVVISQMTRNHFIDEAVADSLQQLPLDMSHYSPQTHNEGLATYLREYIRDEMKDWCKHHKKPDGDHYDVHKDGLKIYTTIDSRMQRYAEEAVRKHMSGEIQPAFFRELKRRGGDPFVGITKEQEEKFLVQAMKQSDRYYQMKKQGMSEKEIRKAFHEKVHMRVFSWNGTRDTVMSPWDSLLYYKKFLNVGLMSVEPGTGHVKAYVGGINYRYFKYDNVRSLRQVGSTFKPFVYAMGIQDLDMYPCTEVPNSQVCFENWDGSQWCPKNSSHERENEIVTLKWALAHSINWVSAYIMKQGSPEQVIAIAKKMGVKSKIEAVPAICVGTPEITVYEMAAAMATFANRGEYVKPIIITRIVDNKGALIEQRTTEHSAAVSENVAAMMLQMMQGVVESGTGVRLRYKYHIEYPMAGKTGTTQNNSDCWFVGITPRLATAVWTGGELRSIHFNNMTYGQGASMALPIFAHYMLGIYGDKSINFYRGDFDWPADPMYNEENCTRFKEEVDSEQRERQARGNDNYDYYDFYNDDYDF